MLKVLNYARQLVYATVLSYCHLSAGHQKPLVHLPVREYNGRGIEPGATCVVEEGIIPVDRDK